MTLNPRKLIKRIMRTKKISYKEAVEEYKKMLKTACVRKEVEEFYKESGRYENGSFKEIKSD